MDENDKRIREITTGYFYAFLESSFWQPSYALRTSELATRRRLAKTYASLRTHSEGVERERKRGEIVAQRLESLAAKEGSFIGLSPQDKFDVEKSLGELRDARQRTEAHRARYVKAESDVVKLRHVADGFAEKSRLADELGVAEDPDAAVERLAAVRGAVAEIDVATAVNETTMRVIERMEEDAVGDYDALPTVEPSERAETMSSETEALRLEFFGKKDAKPVVEANHRTYDDILKRVS